MTGTREWIGSEWRNLGLKFQLQPTVILLSAGVLLAAYRCYGSSPFFDRHLAQLFHAGPGSLGSVLYQFGSCFLWMLVMPAVLLRFVLKRKLSDIGVQAGDAKAGLLALAVLLPIVVLILVPASRQPDFRAQYPLFQGAGRALSLFVTYELLYAVYYIAWEFFFRGFMLFGLKDFVGAANAILIQTVPSTLLHIGKPDGEIFAAVVAGVVFGMIALRTRSILYVFLLHWLIGVTLDVFIVLTPA